VKADPFRQLRLLDLQALDTRLAQLAHSRKVLPQHAEIADLEGHAKTLDDELVRVRTAVGDVEREVAKAEADVQLVRDRAERDRSRLEAGVGTSKDLMGLQHELETLARRQSELEDIELEVMERAEALQSDLAELTAGRARLTERMDALVAARDAALADLDAEAEQVGAPRAGIVQECGAELVALYERIRANSGTGAAALRARRCGGCQLELNNIELGRIKNAPSDEVVRCEECSRILVRTHESGL
jgi:predicted  nucleic acid-binding Zn-ribbon protein